MMAVMSRLPLRGAASTAVALGALVSLLAVDTAPARADDPRSEAQAVFDASCVKCHGARRTSAGLDLSADATGGLAGRASTQAPSMALVEPGNPDASYLFLKITDRHEGTGEGARMPLSGGALAPDDVEAVRRWIAAGAP